jgi:phosphoribosyl 1,2-cyclic phosphodiesterase
MQSEPDQNISNDKPTVEIPIIPLHCFGFRFGAQLVYISDVSAVPETAWRHLRPAPTVLVLDCLRSEPHTSHFGIKQAVACVREVGAPKNLLIGFNHEIAHEEWEHILPVAEGIRYEDCELAEMREVARKAVGLVEEGPRAWIRPAFDGMRLWIENGDVRITNY